MGIDLGSCVLVSLRPDSPTSAMRLEGVVREVVAIEDLPVTPHFGWPARPLRASNPRYIVQTVAGNLLRSAVQMVVVSL